MGGIIKLFSSISGASFKFIIKGTVGPKISASSNPTRLPFKDNETAKLTFIFMEEIFSYIKLTEE